MPRKTLAIDFDGVINSYVSGWQGAEVIPDPPNPGAIEQLELYAKEFTVVIHSSRFSQSPFGCSSFSAVRQWLRKGGLSDEIDIAAINGQPPDRPPIDTIYLSAVKPHAWLTIDDRCFLFQGRWPTVSEINNFRPWKAETLDVGTADPNFAPTHTIKESDPIKSFCFAPPGETYTPSAAIGVTVTGCPECMRRTGQFVPVKQILDLEYGNKKGHFYVHEVHEIIPEEIIPEIESGGAMMAVIGHWWPAFKPVSYRQISPTHPETPKGKFWMDMIFAPGGLAQWPDLVKALDRVQADRTKAINELVTSAGGDPTIHTLLTMPLQANLADGFRELIALVPKSGAKPGERWTRERIVQFPHIEFAVSFKIGESNDAGNG